MKQITTTLLLAGLLFTTLSAQQGGRTQQLIDEAKKYYQMKNYVVAQQYVDLALELDPNNTSSLAQKALILYKSANDSTALEYIQQAIDLKADHPYYYSIKADICNHFKKYNAAIDACNQALELNPNLKEAYGNRSVAYWYLGFSGQAHLDLDKVVQLSNGTDAKAYHNKAVFFKDEKKYQEALTYYNKAIELQPDYAFAYYNRGKLYLLLNDQATACSDFLTAVELGLSLDKEGMANKFIEQNNCLIKSNK